MKSKKRPVDGKAEAVFSRPLHANLQVRILSFYFQRPPLSGNHLKLSLPALQERKQALPGRSS